jgi:high affinity Mn2+ porin
MKMNSALRFSALAVAGMIASIPAQAGEADLIKEMKRLSARLEALEKRNQELENRLATPVAAPAATLEKRVAQLEESKAQVEQSLNSERLSDKDSEEIMRLKDVEFRVLSMQKQARTIESLEGISVGASLVMVGQSANSAAIAAGSNKSELNYRGDISVTLPGGEIGNAEGSIFAQFRVGQGNGLALNNTYSSTPNSTAFSLTNSDDASAILAQAWYQLDVPLPFGGHKPNSREHLEINAGKIDPFVFFDQNVAADDESAKFLNNAFVHNPLLDSGGDAGVDAYGFTPGFRLAYHSELSKPKFWRASVGVFGSGNGASFDDSFKKPFVIGQLEFGRKLFGGLDGNYRAYAWTNGQNIAYQNEVGPELERHSGWGLSMDQRVGDAATLFARFGQNVDGQTRFDQALTLGAELGGSDWGRSGDGLGLAMGWLKTSSDFKQNSSSLDADGDGLPDFAYAANGTEQLAELYYRIRLNNKLELTPDFQWIANPGGDKSAPDAKVWGLRAKVSY